MTSSLTGLIGEKLQKTAQISLLPVVLSARLATLQNSLKPEVHAAHLLLFAADHGISKSVPGVSAYPRSVTPAMFGAIARGQAASTVLAAANGCGVILTDVGVDGDVLNIAADVHHSITVLHRKVGCLWGVLDAGCAVCLALTVSSPLSTPQLSPGVQNLLTHSLQDFHEPNAHPAARVCCATIVVCP